MIKCKKCGSKVKICASVPIWYASEAIIDSGDYALCPKCGKLDTGEVKVIFEKKKKQ